MDLTAVRVEHPEAVAVDVDHFIAARHMAERLADESANGVELFIAEVGIEAVIEIFNGGERLENIIGFGNLANEILAVIVDFILNVTDNLFKNILNGHQA